MQYAASDLIGVRLKGGEYPSRPRYNERLVNTVNACAAVRVYLARNGYPPGSDHDMADAVAAYYGLDVGTVKEAIGHLRRRSLVGKASVPIAAAKPVLAIVPTLPDLPVPGEREWYLERLRAVAVRLGRPPSYLDLMKAQNQDGFPVGELYQFWDSIPEALAEAGVVEVDEAEVA